MAFHDAPVSLDGRRIAVPESRQLDVLEGLLVRRGAGVLRCPLVSIVDAPDPAPIVEWLLDFVERPPDIFILLTGEGLARLHGFAETAGIDEAELVAALKRTTLVSRGPKPARELRYFGLVPDVFAAAPTTAGVIDSLRGMDVQGRRVAVQLYGDDPNETLLTWLEKHSATVTTVAPYRYAPRLSLECVVDLIQALGKGDLDAIVFTSMAQVERLFEVAAGVGRTDELKAGLARTCVAAIGPVVSATLAEHGCRVDVMPEERYFMKPLVHALSNRLATFRRKNAVSAARRKQHSRRTSRPLTAGLGC